MPVNYIKEKHLEIVKKIGLQVNLDNNPGLGAKFLLNSVEKDDYSDLIKFSNKIRKAENSSKQLNNLLNLINVICRLKF